MYICGVWSLAPSFKSMIHPSTPLFINHTWHGHSSKNLATGARPCPPIALKASANIAKGAFVVTERTTVWTSVGVRVG